MDKKTFIIDLDNTIFDTKRYREDIFLFFVRLGIKDVLVRDSYASLAKDDGYNYSIEIHLNLISELYGIDVGVFNDEIRVFKEKSLAQYVRANVFDVLDKIKQNGHRTVLFSKGNAFFQELKLHKSGLGSYFDEIIIVRPDQMKEDALKTLRTDRNTYFINDNWQETKKVCEAYPEIICILFIRPDAEKFYNIKEVSIGQIRDFSELMKVIK